MSPNLATSWLGLPLRNPLVVGAAAPLSSDADQLVALEQAGAAAIVLHSLFEEQIERDQLHQHQLGLAGSDSHAEALGYVPAGALCHGGADHYLRLMERGRARLHIPLVASLNGCHAGSWVGFARRLEGAGAVALELNIYAIPTDPQRSSASIEDELVAIVAEVRAAVSLPLAVKLGPFYTNLTALASRLVGAGADGLTLFNRFYQPDLDIEALAIRPNLLLSTPHDLRLPLRWIALLHGRLPLDLAASGGVHRGTDVVRLLMAGAGATQVVGALLRHGPRRLAVLVEELSNWLADHGYASVQELIGCLDQRNCPDPSAYERAQYIEALHTYPIGEAITAAEPW
jgi:dihydroorotate dehydrogenase (fumarate)